MDLYTYPSNDYRSYLEHHGVKGQRWGVRRYQNSDGSLTTVGKKHYRASTKAASELLSFMRNNIQYSEFTKLKSADEVEKTKSGSCHDQVMYEIKKLRELGYKPKAQFVIEYNPKTGEGGTTHSFVYFKNGDQTIWFENAWGGNEGLHRYNSLKDIKADIRAKQKNGEFGDSTKYSKLEFSDFKPDKQRPGSSLQEVVDVALTKEPSITKDVVKGAAKGALDSAINSGVKGVVGIKSDIKKDVAAGAISGAAKSAIDHAKRRRVT